MEPEVYDYVPVLEPSESTAPREYWSQTIDLDDENTVIVVHDALDPEQLREYIESASRVDRVRGLSAFNRPKPRIEVAYTPDGRPFSYSRQLHYTTKYPEHVLTLVPTFLDLLSDEVNEELTGLKLSTGIDIVYPAEFEGSGSIGAHSDDEMVWALILVYSLGQTRYFRIRDKEKQGGFINVELPHNSLVAMYGRSFQDRYTHQIDRLKDRDERRDRHSLNIRFRV